MKMKPRSHQALAVQSHLETSMPMSILEAHCLDDVAPTARA